MKKRWYLLWALALAAFMACNEAGGVEENENPSGASSSSSGISGSSSGAQSSDTDEPAFTLYESAPGIWDVSGRITANDADIVDVSYTLLVDGSPVTGAIYAYALKDKRPSEGPLQELDLGQGAGSIPGLETEIHLEDMGGVACAHGEDSLELDLTVVVHALQLQTILADTMSVEGRVVSRLACPEGFVYNEEEPEPDPVPADAPLKDKGLVVLGGAKATAYSSWDLDSLKDYGGSSVEGGVANRIDLVYSGTKLMTPGGTAEAGYMTRFYASSASDAILQKLDAEKAAQAKDASALMELLDGEKLTFVTSVAQGDYFLLITSDAMLMLLHAEQLDETKQELGLRVWSVL